MLTHAQDEPPWLCPPHTHTHWNILVNLWRFRGSSFYTVFLAPLAHPGLRSKVAAPPTLNKPPVHSASVAHPSCEPGSPCPPHILGVLIVPCRHSWAPHVYGQLRGKQQKEEEEEVGGGHNWHRN